jgi:hypothetical protein
MMPFALLITRRPWLAMLRTVRSPTEADLGRPHARNEAPAQRWIDVARTFVGESSAADPTPSYPATFRRFHRTRSDSHPSTAL